MICTLSEKSALLIAFWSPGQGEMLLLLVIALLLYGGKLPEVAKSWGKTFAEFRRSWSGIQQEFNQAIYSEPAQLEYQDDDYNRTGYVESDDEYLDDMVDPDEEVSDEEVSDGGGSDQEVANEPVQAESAPDKSAAES